MTLLMPNANSIYTMHVGDHSAGAGISARSLSPRLWSHMYKHSIAPDGGGGCTWFGDDFTNFSLNQAGDASGALTFPSIEGVGAGAYHCYLDVGASVAPIQSDTAADWGGVVRIIGGDTDDDVAVLCTHEFLGYDVANTAQKLTIFEARVRIITVTDGSAFIGLGSAEMRADGGLIAAGSGAPIATANAIGFNIMEDDPNGWDFIHQAASQADVRTSSVQDAVASTWYKLGFVIDPKAPAANRVKIYVDNTEQTSYITSTVVEGTTFPADVGLGLVAATMTETNGTEEKIMDIDWWAVYQAP